MPSHKSKKHKSPMDFNSSHPVMPPTNSYTSPSYLPTAPSYSTTSVTLTNYTEVNYSTYSPTGDTEKLKLIETNKKLERRISDLEEKIRRIEAVLRG